MGSTVLRSELTRGLVRFSVSIGCTVSNKTVSMFAHLAFMVPYLHRYSSESHDPSFTRKPRIPPFRGRAHHVITTGIRRDMLTVLGGQH